MAAIVSDGPKLRDIDKNEKTEFQCDWLGKKINLKLGGKETDVSVGESIEKIDIQVEIQRCPNLSGLMALRRMYHELLNLLSNPPVHYSIRPELEDLFLWRATLMGPSDSPYEGGKSEVTIRFTQRYPVRPPKVKFITQIYHPNVCSKGRIGLDILQDSWRPTLTIPDIMMAIRAMMSQPDLNYTRSSDVSEVYMNDRGRYTDTARAYTMIYATDYYLSSLLCILLFLVSLLSAHLFLNMLIYFLYNAIYRKG
ncbi:Ubiquitin-conjugating enzyme E2 D2B [Araneus ventricosus]|uniref:Ubiquitin-conjugating enzyme E2 D2B n=1 Tax=Araneus ventricosus TaxID=182803 RepID=A0A4Y2L6W6_ARAVE|nr:Ubiquitin-conjugating enzyme E2 D2B [Araneus ventricosus]